MEEEDVLDVRTFGCIGSDGQSYELTVLVADGEERLRLADGSNTLRLSKGVYKAAGRRLYLWSSDPNAP